ncbi:anti-phage dCTP deaminase [Cellvibrio fontiphilus]|uniref:Anti-phage dCTP deaminase n=1 Tax=Cellvibrio fontiphilus TaxID=1815559 RepID=A0ABV7FAH1_9GAMM
MLRDESLSKLFLERSKFILIGLTGRTGSGCTTAANFLENKTPSFPDESDITYNGEHLYSGLSRYRYNIVKKYAVENWKPFYSIKVSDLISAYLLRMSSDEVVDFITVSSRGEVDKTGLKKLIDEGVFSKNFIGKFKQFQNYLLDHSNSEVIEIDKIELFNRYLKLVRKFTEDFKKELQVFKRDLYVSTYQAAGVSIRKLGKISATYNAENFDPSSVFHLPETINRVIKIIRKIEDKAFVVIDAIRNPYEARFFRDRYSAFYLVSINAPAKDRDEYLQRIRKFTIDQLSDIEEIESGDKKIDSTYNDFIGQNVKRCIEISDIHIFNPRNELKNNNVLKAQLIWYFALMLHPGLVSPTSMERVMQIAYTAKSNSGCISRKVGAAITDEENSIKAIGWNDVAAGQVPCALRSVEGLLNTFDPVVYSEYERNDEKFIDAANKKYSNIIASSKSLGGRNLSYCFKDLKNSIDRKSNQVHTRSLHAEESAFLQLAKYGGVGIKGGKLYTTASPCELCAKKAYQLGIKEIIYIDPYPGIARDHILSIGNNPPTLIQFMGAVGKGYHQLYDSAMPYKDELDYFLG